jgi:hypothetical protein
MGAILLACCAIGALTVAATGCWRDAPQVIGATAKAERGRIDRPSLDPPGAHQGRGQG